MSIEKDLWQDKIEKQSANFISLFFPKKALKVSIRLRILVVNERSMS